MIMKKNIITISCDEDITMMGHTFHGIRDIKRYAREQTDASVPYILERYKLFPCFDDFDYASENRYFNNYLFCASKAEADEKKEAFESCPVSSCNFCLVGEKMPDNLFPMLYYEDECRRMKLAECCECDTSKVDDMSEKSVVAGDDKAPMRIFNLIILDESGSMISILQQAVTGVNETIQTIQAAQKEFPGQQQFVTLSAFNSSHIHTIYDAVPADHVEQLSSKEYVPSCSTPLYDAMGDALTHLKTQVGAADKVLVTVITDGYENDSKEYDARSIRTLVNELKSEGWTFAYIGANQDAQRVAESLSIHNALQFDTTVEGTQCMFQSLNSSRHRWLDSLYHHSKQAEGDFFDEKGEKKS
jgi:hypothetical protein